MGKLNTPKADRPRRKSLKRKGPLKLRDEHKDPNKVGRWVNDIDDNIAEMQDLGYDFVNRKIETHDGIGETASDMGTRIKKTKGSTTQYYMEIDRDLYEENQRFKEEENLENDQAMGANTRKQGFYGEHSRNVDN